MLNSVASFKARLLWSKLVRRFGKNKNLKLDKTSQEPKRMASFLKEDWVTASEEDRSRARGAFIAFTTGLEEGMMREQFKSIMDPMLNLQDIIITLAEVLVM